MLGSSWAVLGPSWAVLGPSWAVLGPAWGLPETSWRCLGAFLDHTLETPWGLPWHIYLLSIDLCRFTFILVSVFRRFAEPFVNPRSTEVKIQSLLELTNDVALASNTGNRFLRHFSHQIREPFLRAGVYKRSNVTNGETNTSKELSPNKLRNPVRFTSKPQTSEFASAGFAKR